MYKYLQVILISINAGSAFGQLPSLHFKQLNADNGLSQGVVYNTVSDSKGYLWLAEYEGFSRFDGISCKTNSEIGKGLNGVLHDVTILTENENVWIGCNKGLYRFSYKEDAFKKIDFNPAKLHLSQKINGHYRPVFDDGKRLLLIEMPDYSYWIYNYKHLSITPLKYPVTNKITLVYSFASIIAGGGNNNYLILQYRVDDTVYINQLCNNGNSEFSWRQFRLLLPKHITIEKICITDNICFFVASKKFYSYNLATGKATIFATFKGDTETVFIEQNKRIWVGTHADGLYVFDYQTKAMLANYRYDANNAGGLPGIITNIYIDSSENLWLCVWGKGLVYSKLNDYRFTHFFDKKEADKAHADNFIRAIAEDKAGNFYCSTQFGGIIKLDKKLRFVDNLRGFENIETADLFLDTANQIWFGSGGLTRYDLNTHRCQRILQPAWRHRKYDNANNYVHFSTMQNGNLLASTEAGLWCINVKKNTIDSLAGVSSINDRVILYGYEDRRHHLFKCTLDSGLVVYNQIGNTNIKAFSFPEQFAVKHILEINDSTLWIATSDGLILYDPSKHRVKKKYTTTDGLPGNTVYAVVPDKLERLWLSTNKGISLFTPQLVSFKNFKVADGLQANEYNRHVAITAKDGRIIFGGVNGLNAFLPENIHNNHSVPAVQITSIISNDTINPFQFDDNLNNKCVLPAGNNILDISFSANELVNPTSCKLKYRLRGFENSWVPSQNPGRAQFFKLPAGNYTFEIMSANADGVWGTQIKKLRITILAYWWQRIWFKILVVFFVIAVVSSSIKIYVKNKLEKQRLILERKEAVLKERERISTELHDDIGGELSAIRLLSEIRVGTISPDQQLEKISVTSVELIQKLNEIVWAMNINNDSLQGLIGYIRRYAVKYLDDAGIKCNCDFISDFDIPDINIGGNERRAIFLLVKEALNNVVKHSHATEVNISIRVARNLQLVIHDNGIGFTSSGIAVSGNGLKNMHLRVSKLKGWFSMDTNSGTCVKFDLPLNI